MHLLCHTSIKKEMHNGKSLAFSSVVAKFIVFHCCINVLHILVFFSSEQQRPTNTECKAS